MDGCKHALILQFTSLSEQLPAVYAGFCHCNQPVLLLQKLKTQMHINPRAFALKLPSPARAQARQMHSFERHSNLPLLLTHTTQWAIVSESSGIWRAETLAGDLWPLLAGGYRLAEAQVTQRGFSHCRSSVRFLNPKIKPIPFWLVGGDDVFFFFPCSAALLWCNLTLCEPWCAVIVISWLRPRNTGQAFFFWQQSKVNWLVEFTISCTKPQGSKHYLISFYSHIRCFLCFGYASSCMFLRVSAHRGVNLHRQDEQMVPQTPNLPAEFMSLCVTMVTAQQKELSWCDRLWACVFGQTVRKEKNGHMDRASRRKVTPSSSSSSHRSHSALPRRALSPLADPRCKHAAAGLSCHSIVLLSMKAAFSPWRPLGGACCCFPKQTCDLWSGLSHRYTD